MRLTMAVGIALLAGLAQTSFGAMITNGFFDISGTFYVTNPEATPVVTPAGTCPAITSCIFWQDGSGTHNEEVDISAAGLPNGTPPNNVLAGIAGADGGNIDNLESSTAPVGSAISIPAFFTFNNGGVTTALTLTFIDPGFYSSTDCALAPAVGQVCTPVGSLFNFVNNPPTPGEATASWVFEGTTNTPGVIWTANFTSQFPANTPFQTVLSDLSTNGYVDNTFSGTISLGPASAVPEPGSVGLMTIMSGLIGLVAFRRRRLAS